MQMDYIIHVCDLLHFRAHTPISGPKWAARFADLGGPEGLLQAMTKWKEMEVLVRACLRCLITMGTLSDEVCTSVLELGGLAVLESCREAHLQDDFIVHEAPVLAALLSKQALKLARLRIQEQLAAFKVCGHCKRPLADMQDLTGAQAHHHHHHDLHHSTTAHDKSGFKYKNMGGNLDGIVAGEEDSQVVVEMDAFYGDSEQVDPRREAEKERISTIVGDMMKYPNEEAVQDVGCEAIMALSKSGSEEAVVEGQVVPALVAAANTFPDSRLVQWKAASAASALARMGESVCCELGKRGMVASLMAALRTFPDAEVKQLVIYALSECSTFEINFQRMVHLRLEELLNQVAEQVAKEKHGFSIHIPDRLASRFKRPTQEDEMDSDEEAVDEDEFVVTEKKGNVWDPIKPPKPKFGTVADLWAQGEKGLV